MSSLGLVVDGALVDEWNDRPSRRKKDVINLFTRVATDIRNGVIIA